jgi:hypothetical protein
MASSLLFEGIDRILQLLVDMVNREGQNLKPSLPAFP